MGYIRKAITLHQMTPFDKHLAFCNSKKDAVLAHILKGLRELCLGERTLLLPSLLAFLMALSRE